MTAATITGSQGVFWRPSAPAAPPLRVAHKLRSQNRLAAIVLAAITAFALLLAAAPHATGVDLFGSETRVAAQTDPAQAFVGFEAPVSPAFVGGNGAYAYDGVLGCCVAPNGTPGNALYHYTDEAGLDGIVSSGELRPSLGSVNPNDVRYGNGQYVSDIVPGTRTCAQLSRCFLGQPFQGQRFTHFVEINVDGLNLVKGRDGVFVIPGDSPLDLTGRIVSSGPN